MGIRNNQGQTVVEYLLLMAVAVSLVITFYKSEAFQRLFGEQGRVGAHIKSQSEFSYRHAYTRGRPDVDVPRDHRDGSTHPSYSDLNNGGTRFFGPRSAYP